MNSTPIVLYFLAFAAALTVFIAVLCLFVLAAAGLYVSLERSGVAAKLGPIGDAPKTVGR
jgi:hypothetical protein